MQKVEKLSLLCVPQTEGRRNRDENLIEVGTPMKIKNEWLCIWQEAKRHR
jgi:predicted GH43/DUF377 family glycosyl hydrolase